MVTQAAHNGWQAPITAPGPSGGDMLGSFSQIRRDPRQFLIDTWRAHGDVVQFPIPRPATYLISNPQDARTVLVSPARDQSKRTLQYDNLAEVTGNGLLTCDDPPWRDHRRLMQPAFHADEMATVIAESWSALDGMVGSADARGRVVDLEHVMLSVSMQVVAAALFGSDWHRQASSITTASQLALDCVVARARNPLPPPRWLPTPGNRQLAAATRRIDRAVDTLLSQRLNQAPRGDFVDLLIAGLRTADGDLDRRAVRDELVTFIVAGHETVASALTWTWYLLMRDDHVLARLTDEAADAPFESLSSHEQLTQLPYTRAVIDEALRLYPPAWVMTRRLNQPITLESRAAQEAASPTLPQDALVIISPAVVHQHPEAWQHPTVFDPERFMGVNSRMHPGYLPFGLGPRMCIGRQFALDEAAVVLFRMVRELTVTPVDDRPITPYSQVTLRPKRGLWVRLASR